LRRAVAALGRAAEAARFAERAIAEFERADVDAIVVNSAGCGSAMKEFGGFRPRGEHQPWRRSRRAGRAGRGVQRPGA
jgi:glycolate oxidase iron-sulfur subunit